MRVIILIVCISIGVTVFAQDDMPDYRSKRENFSKMQEKDIKADLASFTMAGIDEGVGKGTLQSIPPTASGNNFITFSQDYTSVKIVSGSFDKSKHKLGYYDKYLVKIDNKPFYSNYGKVPVKTIDTMIVVIEGDTIDIPKAAYADLYNPVFTYYDNGKAKTNGGVYFSKDKHKMYIYLMNRIEGGSYEVTWVIQDKKYLRRVVDYGFLKE